MVDFDLLCCFQSCPNLCTRCRGSHADAALACMSSRPRLVHEYFKQLFAQVGRSFGEVFDACKEVVVSSVQLAA